MSIPDTLYEELHAALLGAFSRAELTLFVRTHLDANFEALTADKNLTAQVDELLRWTERRGRLRERLRAPQPNAHAMARCKPSGANWISFPQPPLPRACPATAGASPSRATNSSSAAAMTWPRFTPRCNRARPWASVPPG